MNFEASTVSLTDMSQTSYHLGIRDYGVMKLGIRDYGVMRLGIRDYGVMKLGIRDYGVMTPTLGKAA